MNAMSLQAFDEAATGVAKQLHAALVSYGAEKVRFCYRVTPDGSVMAPDYWFTPSGGAEVKDYPPNAAHRLVSDGAEAHWRLTQDLGLPRWYMMTVKLERSGKYSVDYEYRDDYQEGDIMKELD